MRRGWEPEDVIACWTLGDEDWRLLSNKRGATRLGFALLLKFFELEARFPRHSGEVPGDAVSYVAGQVKVPAEAFSEYEWSGRTIEYHRSQVRSALARQRAWDAEQKAATVAREKRRLLAAQRREQRKGQA